VVSGNFTFGRLFDFITALFGLMELFTFL